jgi:hypothetical protein
MHNSQNKVNQSVRFQVLKAANMKITILECGTVHNEVSGSHSTEYEDDCVLECGSIQALINWLRISRCLLPPPSGPSPK